LALGNGLKRLASPASTSQFLPTAHALVKKDQEEEISLLEIFHITCSARICSQIDTDQWRELNSRPVLLGSRKGENNNIIHTTLKLYKE